MRRVLDRVLHEERGGVIVIVVGFLPVAIGLAAFVIDIGNGMEHRRHLQLQADAGAYAAASEFNGCRNDPAAANEAIRQKATEYAATKNALLGDDGAQDRVRTVINGTDYDSADFSAGTPCETGWVDVKLQEEDSPAFFGFVGTHDYRGHARVQVFSARVMDGLLPLAMPVPDPRTAQATFVDETTDPPTPLLDGNGDPIVADLVPAGEEGGLSIWQTGTLNEDGTISANPVDLEIPSEHVGVRVVLSGSGSTDCEVELVTCYDAGSENGLSHIRGWSDAAKNTTDPPVLRGVTLESGPGCDNAYFSSPSVPCDAFDVSAIVDFGGNPTAVNGDVTAAVVGGNGTYDLSPDGTDPASGAWTSDESIPVTAGSGPIEIELTVEWETRRPSDRPNCKNNCTITETHEYTETVQRHFAASRDRAGPIELLEVSKDGSAANSLQEGATHALDVKIGIEGEIELAPPNSPVPQYMRIAGDSGSQTQALDCNANGAGDFRWEIVLGCTALYREHRGTATWTPCPDDVSGMAQPWECVEVTTGDRTNNPAAALNQRILGDEKPNVCPPADTPGHNNWPHYDTLDFEDPRVISVFLTRFNAFEGRQGNFTVPITGFASFYVTGWTSSGGGFANPCQQSGNGDEIPRDAGEIVGRYISRVEVPNDVGGGGITCNFDEINPCTAVLVD